MKYYDQSVKINHNLNWSYIPDNPYRILITGGSGSGKPNVLFISTKSIYTSKYELLINRREKVGIKKWKKSKRIHWIFTNKWWCFWKFGRS